MWWANIVTVVLCLSISVANFWNLSLPTTYYHSPLVVADNNQTEEPVTVTFVGDLLLARHVENLMMQHGTDYPFLGQNLSSSTYVFANFESVVPRQHEKTKVRSIKFSTPKWAVQALLDAGFTHLSLANNHSFDFGQSGLSNTKQILKQNNLSYFGHPHEINTSSTEYINFSTSTVAVTGINFLNTSLSKESISYLESLEANSDYQIAFVHWGEEYNPTAGLTQRQQASQLVESGFDLIIGHHPHVVQNIEVIDGVVVVYSLGNYIFDQYFSKDVQTGLIAHLHLSSKEVKLAFEPVTSLASLSQPGPMSAQDQDYFLKELAVASSGGLLSSITKGELILASFDEKVIMDEIKFTYVQ